MKTILLYHPLGETKISGISLANQIIADNILKATEHLANRIEAIKILFVLLQFGSEWSVKQEYGKSVRK